MIERTPSRTDILSLYRQRIHEGARTRLTQAEQTALIDAFIDDLAQLDTPDAIEARCQAELTLLEDGYPTQTVASKLLAPYRKAIRSAIDAGRLPLNDATSHIVRYTKRATGEQQQTQEHWALTHLKYDRETYARLRDQSVGHNNARQDDLQPIKVDSYLASVAELLTEDDPHTLTAAIAAATGRRHTEVVTRGSFDATAHPYVLRFTGQQKKRDGDLSTTTPFDIVTLVPARSILDAIARLRQHPSVQALHAISTVNDPIMRAFNSQVNREVKRRFEETGIVPRLSGARSVSIHRLRGVYAAIAVYLWCPEGQHEARFLQHYLGHAHNDAILPNSEATSHYFHYRLLDGDGKPLHAKGILRNTLGVPPEASDTTTPAQTTSTTRRPVLAVADLGRFHQLTDQFGIDGSAAQRFRALLDWAEAQQQALTVPQNTQEQSTVAMTPTSAEIILEAPERAIDAPEAPIVAPPPAPQILPIISDQAKTMAWLTDEISTLRVQLATAQQTQAEGRNFRAERSILQAKINSLTQENQTLRRRLDRFEGLRQALWGNDNATSAPDTAAAPQDAPTAPTHAEGRDTASTTPALQRAPARAVPSGRGQDRAGRIWQTIRAWNEAPNRPTHEKVALSVSTLEKRFGLFRPTAKAWLEAHQQEVEQHNQAHRITAPTHNRSVPDEVWETLKEQAR